MRIYRTSKLKTADYVVYIGTNELLGRPRRFQLGANWLEALKRAKRLELLWESVGKVWTDEAMKEARLVARGEAP